MVEILPNKPQSEAPQPVPVAAPVTYAPAANTQPVFYSLLPEEAPKPTSRFKKRQMIILAASIVGLVIVVGLVVAFATNAIRASNTAKNVAVQKAGTVQQLVANGKSQSDAARQVGFVDGCKCLDDGPLANCVSLIASDAADPNVCVILNGEEKALCVDRANTASAIKDGKFSSCETVADATLRAGCEAVIMEKARLTSNCAAFGVPDSVCAATGTDMAVASGDIKACDSLSEEEKGACLDMFYSIDSDVDGLSDGDELAKYFTDPKNPNTDGDGYTDGDEVLSGHDPLNK